MTARYTAALQAQPDALRRFQGAACVIGRVRVGVDVQGPPRGGATEQPFEPGVVPGDLELHIGSAGRDIDATGASAITFPN